MDLHTPFIDWIDTQKFSIEERLERWVEINSFSGNSNGIKQLTDVISNDFSSLEAETQLIDLKANDRFALSLQKRATAPIQILLCGHLDTVFSPTTPFQKMRKLSEDLWNGPGVSDMKGGILVMLMALEALERSPSANKIGWRVLLTPDEEIGSPDSGWLLKKIAPQFDYGLVFEPAFSDGAFVSERMGSSNFSVIVNGISAHVGRDYAKGRSAGLAIARLIAKLEQECKAEEIILNIANIECHSPLNIVPNKGSFQINLRSFEKQHLINGIIKLEQLAKQESVDGIQIIIHQNSLRFPKSIDQKTEKLFKRYESCAQQLNIPFFTRRTGGVCDGNLLAEEGLPVIDSVGAVGGSLHTFDEYVIVSSLIERAKLTALFLMSF